MRLRSGVKRSDSRKGGRLEGSDTAYFLSNEVSTSPTPNLEELDRHKLGRVC
jgi:hypothetical protein